MPLLTGTAFLHSVMIQERRGMLKMWNAWLVAITFLLTIFGTFLTRSGVVSSVHSFGASSLGSYFLVFLAIGIAFSVFTILSHRDLLRSEHRLRRRCGFGATWLGPAALERATGITGSGAIRTKGSAQFDPYRACLGVLRAATDAGARVFEHSEVRRIVTDGERVRLWTREGSVDCERVVIATGYATSRFRPLAGRFRMYRTYALATEPFSARQRREPEIAQPDALDWPVEIEVGAAVDVVGRILRRAGQGRRGGPLLGVGRVPRLLLPALGHARELVLAEDFPELDVVRRGETRRVAPILLQAFLHVVLDVGTTDIRIRDASGRAGLVDSLRGIEHGRLIKTQ
jgi:glycine/D-amino acid oxidase-like deaminating enzyme